MNNCFINLRARRRESFQQITAILRQLVAAVQRHSAIDQEEDDVTGETTEAKRANDEYVDVSMLTDSTQRLLNEFFKAPQYTLDHALIKSFVMYDDHASIKALRKTVCIVRKELKAKNFPFKIVTVRKHGYQLIRKHTLPFQDGATLPNVTEPSKNSEKTSKKIGNVR